MPTPQHSDVTTEDVRVGATARFLPEQSAPDAGRYVFGYRIVIVNQGERPVQLLRRHWRIIDGDGELHEVRGEGVVGQQPRLEPGKGFAYTSFCPLTTPWGTMGGTYLMQRDDGDQFLANVGRFFLTTQQEAGAPDPSQSRG